MLEPELLKYTRGGNLKAIGAYNRRVADVGDARTWEETPGPVERLAETWWLGLRLAEGLTAEEARARAGLARSFFDRPHPWSAG